MERDSSYNREMFTIREVVRKWSQYLFGHHFLIFSDQNILGGPLNQTIQIPTQQWLIKLMGYNFEILYFSGHCNVVVDGLSRCQPVGHLFAAISTYQPIIITELQNFYVSHLVVTVFASNFSIPNNCLFSSKWFCMTKIGF